MEPFGVSHNILSSLNLLRRWGLADHFAYRSGVILDEWVRENSEADGKNWFTALTEHVYGQTGALDCNILSQGNCNIGEDSCRKDPSSHPPALQESETSCQMLKDGNR
jgi:hypothetical protein